MPKAPSKDALVQHGALELPSVIIDSYNLELRDKEGFIGDKASKRAFAEKFDEDPLGNIPTEELSKKQLDGLLKGNDIEAAGLVHGAVEEFAQELATVIRRFLRAKGWHDTERIAVGGGFKESRVGMLSIGRAM